MSRRIGQLLRRCVQPVAALAALPLLPTCSTVPSLLTQIQDLGELRVVTRSGPATWYNGAEGQQGMEHDLAAGLAEQLGVKLSMYTVDTFPQILDEVERGRAHIAAAALSVTESRQQRVQFAGVYRTARPQVIHSLDGPMAATPADLAGKRLEVINGSSHEEALWRARSTEPGIRWQAMPVTDVDALLTRLAQGESDFTVVDSHEFAIARHAYPGLRVAFDLADDAPVAWALPKRADPSLHEAVSRYFARIEADGTLAAISSRYFDAVQEYDYVSTLAFVSHFEERLPDYYQHFTEAAALTGLDWRLLAAVGYQESHWDPAAVSPTGVRGIMMLTQTTASALEVEDRTDPRQSILGGAVYLRQLHERIPERIPEPDRTWMALAAYNIGWGHLEDARVITEMNGADPDRWDEVRRHLPLLTQERWYSRVRRGKARGWQPVYYVDNIQRYYSILQWKTAQERWTPPPDPFSAPLEEITTAHRWPLASPAAAASPGGG